MYQGCIAVIADEESEIVGSCVTAARKDAAEENRKEEVWDKEIKAHKDCLYKEPGYTYG